MQQFPPSQGFPTSYKACNSFPTSYKACNSFPTSYKACNSFPTSYKACNSFPTSYKACNSFPTSYKACNSFPTSYKACNSFPTSYKACNSFPTSYKARNSFPTSYKACNSFPTSYKACNSFPTSYKACNSFPTSYKACNSFPTSYKACNSFPTSYKACNSFPTSYKACNSFPTSYKACNSFPTSYKACNSFPTSYKACNSFPTSYKACNSFPTSYKACNSFPTSYKACNSFPTSYNGRLGLGRKQIGRGDRLGRPRGSRRPPAGCLRCGLARGGVEKLLLRLVQRAGSRRHLRRRRRLPPGEAQHPGPRLSGCNRGGGGPSRRARHQRQLRLGVGKLGRHGLQFRPGQPHRQGRGGGDGPRQPFLEGRTAGILLAHGGRGAQLADEAFEVQLADDAEGGQVLEVGVFHHPGERAAAVKQTQQRVHLVRNLAQPFGELAVINLEDGFQGGQLLQHPPPLVQPPHPLEQQPLGRDFDSVGAFHRLEADVELALEGVENPVEGILADQLAELGIDHPPIAEVDGAGVLSFDVHLACLPPHLEGLDQVHHAHV